MITQIDFFILDLIQSIMKSPVCDAVFTFITHLGDKGILFIALAIMLMLFKKTRKTGFALALGLIIGFIVCNLILKNVFARVRPFDIRDVAIIIPKPRDFSFPSGHSFHAFVCAKVLSTGFKKYSFWFYIVAFLIAFSRLYLYVHYPSDVIVGSILGVLTGHLAVCIIKHKKSY